MEKKLTKKNITLSLTEQSAQQFNELAGEASMSVAELLETFIADLTNGMYSNGSNERAAAWNWYELITYWHDYSFLSYLCLGFSDGVQEVIDLQDDIEYLETQLADVRNDKMTLEQMLRDLVDCEEVRSVSDNYEKVKAIYMQSLLEELKCYREEIAIYWNGYQKESESDETLEEAVEKLRKWQMESFKV